MSTTYFIYSSAYLNQSSAKFQFKQTTLIFWTKFAQKAFPVENRKSEHHHGILQIWISLGIKFQLKTDIFEFLDQIYSKKVFPVQNRTSSPRTTGVCLNSTIVFKHFEDLKELIILKEKFVMSCLLGSFYLKIV